MIVCDLCKDPKVSTFKCRIVLIKEETKKGKVKTSEREVISINVDLCEKHIDLMNQRLGFFIHGIRKAEGVDPEGSGSDES